MLERLGIGIDVASISDFKKFSYDEKPGLYEKLFQSSEIDYCLKYDDPSSHFAGKFALKEAVKKSICEEIPMYKIKTSHKNSKPIVTLSGSKNNYVFRASISHEKDCAIAIVISELIN